MHVCTVHVLYYLHLSENGQLLPSRNGHSRTAFFPSIFSLTRLAVTLLLLTPYQKKRLHSLIQKIVVQNIYQSTYKK